MEWLTEIYTDSFGKSRAVLIEPSKGSLCSGCSRSSDDCGDCSLYKAIQKLNALEVAIGGNYDINRLKELVESDRDGRCVVLPCHIGDPVFMGMGRSKITGYEEDICDGFYIGRDGVLQVKSQCLKGNHGTYGVIGQSAELTSEAAKAALEKMKEREKDG